MKIFKAFTLAEALITLTVIGVVATLTIPSITTNHKKIQYETAYKKAIKTINEAISLNIARGEKSALATTEKYTLFNYLQKNMDIIRSTTSTKFGSTNAAFYTADGMRFEFPKKGNTAKDRSGSNVLSGIKLTSNDSSSDLSEVKTYACGTKNLGMGGSTKAKENEPCVILVDVNGDKKPNILTTSSSNSSDLSGEVADMFVILVTDKGAIPYGTLAQKAFYHKQ